LKQQQVQLFDKCGTNVQCSLIAKWHDQLPGHGRHKAPLDFEIWHFPTKLFGKKKVVVLVSSG